MVRHDGVVRGLATIGIAFIASAVVAIGAEPDSTHQQTAIIKMDSPSQLAINAFCLDGQGRIVAACGSSGGEVRIIDDAGKILDSWSVSVKPEAVNVGPSGTILVGGEGKLFQYSSTGELLLESESPHAKSLKENREELRKQAIERMRQSTRSTVNQVATYERLLKSMEDRRAKGGKKTPSETQAYELIKKRLEEAKAAEANGGVAEPDSKLVEQQVNALAASKLRISSLSSDGQHVFVVTPSIEGYGYSVWRTDLQFENGTAIISGLSGCCGQMDVQCCEAGLFVAENGRHRVVRYDSDGEVVTTWGKRDRTGEEGFLGCCNPMNVCFGAKGTVFTAESGEGRIRQYDVDGKLVANIGSVELVPGCKNVSIAANSDHSKIYMLDLTRNHIVLMTPVEDAADGNDAKGETPKSVLRQAKKTKGE